MTEYDTMEIDDYFVKMEWKSEQKNRKRYKYEIEVLVILIKVE